MNFKFIAVFVLDKKLYAEFCDLIRKTASDLAGGKIPDTLMAVIKESVVDADALFHSKDILEKNMKVERRVAEFFTGVKQDSDNEYLNIKLSKDRQDTVFLKKLLTKYKFGKYGRFAVEKSLEIATSGFAYQVSFASAD